MTAVGKAGNQVTWNHFFVGSRFRPNPPFRVAGAMAFRRLAPRLGDR